MAAHAVPVNANLWVLDFLLESDGLDDTLIKHFHDVNASQFEELPPTTQARLMLRVLKDAPLQPTGIAEAALGALNMLKNLAIQLAEKFGPTANMEPLKPSEDLLIEVKTELVLKGLRDPSQSEHPRVIMDRFFVPDQDNLMLTPAEMGRRNEIVEGLKGSDEIAVLLSRHPVAALNHHLLSFVSTARAALGPNLLKVVEKDMQEGRYQPQAVPPPPPSKRRRKTVSTAEEDGTGMLPNMHQSGAGPNNSGQDPMGDGRLSEQATDSKEGNPGGSETPSGYRRAGPAPRRRNGRWNEEETNFLVHKVREHGKGKWKRILELGAHIFQNRSQVDLKDKWRNLERQGVVGPHDLPPQPLPQIGGQVQLGIPQNLGQGLPHPHLGPDGQLMGPLLSAPGEPLTEAAAQQYAAFAAQYAAQMVGASQQSQADGNQANRNSLYNRSEDSQAQQQQQLTGDILHHLAQASQLSPQTLQQVAEQLQHAPEQHMHQPQLLEQMQHHQADGLPNHHQLDQTPLQADTAVVQSQEPMGPREEADTHQLQPAEEQPQAAPLNGNAESSPALAEDVD